LNDRLVSRLAFLLTGAGYFSGGIAGILNREGCISDDLLGFVFGAVMLTSFLAILVDWLKAATLESDHSCNDDGPYVV
jgi:hypothetical protein